MSRHSNPAKRDSTGVSTLLLVAVPAKRFLCKYGGTRDASYTVLRIDISFGHTFHVSLKSRMLGDSQ